jgi:hypothetical protein
MHSAERQRIASALRIVARGLRDLERRVVSTGTQEATEPTVMAKDILPDIWRMQAEIALIGTVTIRGEDR